MERTLTRYMKFSFVADIVVFSTAQSRKVENLCSLSIETWSTPLKLVALHVSNGHYTLTNSLTYHSREISCMAGTSSVAVYFFIFRGGDSPIRSELCSCTGK